MMDLLAYKNRLIIEQRDEKKLIFCSIRKRFMVLQPEEIVRQIFLLFLKEELHYSIAKTAVEKGLKVSGKQRRFDILVYDQKIEPYILVECKAPHIPIDQNVMDQVGQYNLPLQAEYLVLTNGHQNIFCKLSANRKEYEYIDNLPKKRDGKQ